MSGVRLDAEGPNSPFKIDTPCLPHDNSLYPVGVVMVVRLLIAALTLFGAIPVRVCTCDREHHHHVHFFFLTFDTDKPIRGIGSQGVSPLIETPGPDDSHDDCCCKPRLSMPVGTQVPLPSNAFADSIDFPLPVLTLLGSDLKDLSEFSCYLARPPTSDPPLFTLHCTLLI